MPSLLMSDIRKLPSFLEKTKPLPFFEYVTSDQLIITERQAQPHELQQVIIRNIPHHTSEYTCWKFNLEQEVDGLSPVTGLKVVDTVFMVLTKNILSIFLIELKQSLSSQYNPDGILITHKSSLWKAKEQIQQSISRMYFLLPIILPSHEQLSQCRIRFTGVIFYNYSKSALTDQDRNDKEIGGLWHIFMKETDAFLCTSILRQEKIPVKFVENLRRDEQPSTIEINFDHLLH